MLQNFCTGTYLMADSQLFSDMSEPVQIVYSFQNGVSHAVKSSGQNSQFILGFKQLFLLWRISDFKKFGITWIHFFSGFG